MQVPQRRAMHEGLLRVNQKNLSSSETSIAARESDLRIGGRKLGIDAGEFLTSDAAPTARVVM
jgi:hypothetical protein